MAQRHHLSTFVAVSLLKNHYSNEGFCRGTGRPFDLEVFCIFDTSSIKDFMDILLDYFLFLKLFPGDPILGHPISGTEVSLLGGRGPD